MQYLQNKFTPRINLVYDLDIAKKLLQILASIEFKETPRGYLQLH